MRSSWFALALVALTLAGCGRTTDQPVVFEPDEDCVDAPEVYQGLVLRTVSAEDATTGCREFGEDGCIECCSREVSFDGEVECLALDANGEHLIPGPCAAECPACARCSVEDEETLYDLADTTCDCSEFAGNLGFDPEVPCERDCYFLQSAASSCPHKVCLEE